MQGFAKNNADAFVIGAGPAGLAAAISLRRAGLDVVVADAAQPAIDKACGEGLMPDAVAALKDLGVHIGSGYGQVFHGICFRSEYSAATAHFAQGKGLGLRRTVLHNLLVDHAAALGVPILWNTRVDVIDHGKLTANGAEWKSRWIIGADGQRSRIRQFAQLEHPCMSQRYGFRQHFAVVPWTDCVEVYWAAEGQAYVTPTGNNEVCVALVMENKKNRMMRLSDMFPSLGARLRGSEATSVERGAMTICRRLPRVTRGSIALIGEAAGSIDAVTGEGMALAFKQALALGEALSQSNLEMYERKNRHLRRTPFTMSQLMVFLGRHPRLQSRIIQACAQDTALFSRLMDVHLGMRSPLSISPAILTSFGWNMVTA
ncbi:MAG TPA: NAD(P)/FAD-dependent oxidoreductase [Acidobacteriaceae bacterium]|nr:NAD(P)/FAD-dependent oxidoreductase [Acidobacteriaceae bacterium]